MMVWTMRALERDALSGLGGTTDGTVRLSDLPRCPSGMGDENWPRCSDCRERLTFYGRLDLINHEICIADGGVIHAFEFNTTRDTA